MRLFSPWIRGLPRVLLLAAPVAVLGEPSLWAQQQPGQAASAQAGSTSAVQPYRYITAEERWQWFARSTAGPTSLLAAGPISAAWGTLNNSPEEYGPHWEGFGQRYAMRLTGVATSNAIEAVAGAALREDPRYVSAPAGKSLGGRVGYVIASTFLASRPDGSRRFSYSRVAGNAGSNFLSNLWREKSESTAGDAALRCLWGLTSRMSSFAFAEFGPSVFKKLKRK
jgi:hypothetical protein